MSLKVNHCVLNINFLDSLQVFDYNNLVGCVLFRLKANRLRDNLDYIVFCLIDFVL